MLHSRCSFTGNQFNDKTSSVLANLLNTKLAAAFCTLCRLFSKYTQVVNDKLRRHGTCNFDKTSACTKFLRMLNSKKKSFNSKVFLLDQKIKIHISYVTNKY